jgi:hypothetical protein
MDDFLLMLHRTNIDWDIILVTECWLNSTHYIPRIDGYNYYKSAINITQNEGVVVYCKQSLNIVLESTTIAECNHVSIRINSDTIVIAIYRPPAFRDTNTFTYSLGQCLTQYSNFKNIIVIGDVNIDITPGNVDTNSSIYLNLLASHGLLPAHILPTHTKTCLDHAMLKTKQHAICYVAETSITDHDTIILFLKDIHHCRQRNKTPHKIVKRINYNGLENDINTIQFENIYSCTDVNEATTFLIKTLSNVILKNTSVIKTSNRKTTKKPWLTNGALRCLRNRDKLHQKSKKQPDNDILKTTYKRYRNYCNELLKNLKADYNKTELANATKTNNKKLWNVIKSVTNTNKYNHIAIELIDKTEPTESTNYVNSFFVNIGKSLAEKYNTQSLTPTFPDKIHPHSFVLLDTDTDEIYSLIFKLKSDSSVGRDNISAVILKRFNTILVPPITYIFNLALRSGKFPKKLKLAEVHPVYKSGNRDCVNNYRPISILPTLSKILEKIMNSRLIHYLEYYKLLSHSQFGFRTKRSTNDAVQFLTNYIVTNLDNNDKVIVIFLDLAKAFDTVPAPLLLSKIEKLGVRDKQLELFTDYLSDRYQRVKIGEYYSDDLPIGYGVPQGSVLGPTLFLTYINGLCDLELTNGKIVAFADDTALLFRAKTWPDAFKYAQLGFDKVVKWLSENKLTLNVAKTKYIPFCIRNQFNAELESLFIKSHYCCSSIDKAITCSCPYLTRTDSIKYLGVIIDKNLNFHEHIDLLTSRIRKLIYIFKNLRHVANSDVIRMVYLALVQSLLTYCITSWGGASKTTMIQLERAQRAILKVSKSLPFIYPTLNLYKDCEVLSVRKLFILHTILEKHAKLEYDPIMEKKRRIKNVCPSVTLKTKFSNKFFCFLGNYLYNKLNKELSYYSLPIYKCKKLTKQWLLNLDYETTEGLLMTIL